MEGDLDDLAVSPRRYSAMPLSPSGAKVLSSMQSEYGPGKGERVFYATANKKPALGRKWHGKTSRKVTKR